MSAPTQRGPLASLRVLDLSRVLAGPLAGQILGDLGADVVKVERPGVGDDTRGWGPPYVPDQEQRPTSESAYFMSCNRNKRSIALDITTDAGRERVRALAARADVLLENFKVGGLAQYGLDYDSLSKINPRLIYCSITGFGQTGPYAARAGYDFLLQGMGGLMSLTGVPENEPGSGPMKAGVALIDVMSGLYSVIGVLAALAHRERTGAGQRIDISLFDVGIAGLVNQAMNYLATGQSPRRMGNSHPSIVPYQDLPTADGYVCVAVGNDSQFARLCTVLGHEAWARDPRFATNAARVRHRDTLIPMLSAVTAARRADELIQLLEAAGVPCGPINDLAAVFSDAHVRERDMVIKMQHPLAGQVPQVASPLRMSASPVTYRRAPPVLGEHTEAIMRDWLGVVEGL